MYNCCGHLARELFNGNTTGVWSDYNQIRPKREAELQFTIKSGQTIGHTNTQVSA